ncbi:hypothetical protein LTR17_027784 [Elasticomyces elasticus]|nr:hypothetical protein LTR17_027784 [Elasticomyces elasticus]
MFVEEKYGAGLHGKCMNLLRKMNDDYDRAFADVDVFVMPTLPSPPCRLFDDPAAHGPLERLSRNVGLVGNCAPFDSKFPGMVSQLYDVKAVLPGFSHDLGITI